MFLNCPYNPHQSIILSQPECLNCLIDNHSKIFIGGFNTNQCKLSVKFTVYLIHLLCSRKSMFALMTNQRISQGSYEKAKIEKEIGKGKNRDKSKELNLQGNFVKKLLRSTKRSSIQQSRYKKL